MDDMLIWILAGVGVSLLMVPLLLGMMISSHQQATRVELIKAPPEDVWSMLTELSRQTEWRKDLKSIQLKDDDDGMRWEERNQRGENIVLRKLKEVPRKEIIVQLEKGKRIVGTRQAVLHAVPGGTRVTFTETAKLRSPWMRLRAQFGSRLDLRLNAYIEQVKQGLLR